MFSPQFFFICAAGVLMFEPVSSQKDSKAVTVKPRKTVTLPCQGPRNASITLIKWSRTDLKPDGYVFYYQNKRSYENYQHQSFRGRVELSDPEMKDGNVSVMLKNVNFNDSGIYKCLVRSSEDNNTVFIQLMVTNTGVTDVTQKAGDDATLPCQDPRNANITLLEWSRLDLESNKHVFIFRENRSHEIFQLPSFRGRMELRDPEMKDGDVSVVLKNVTFNDTGTYECRVIAASGGQMKRDSLTAGQIEDGGTEDEGTKDGGTKDGNVGLQVGLPVVVLVVLVGVVGFMIFRNRRRRTENNSYQPPADEEADQQL